MIDRIQYPVGQGGFYAEHHRWPGSRAVVYDCGAGCLGITPSLSREIQAFHDQSTHLDALVLSHFHADHLNGIHQLLAKITGGARRIFLPYLSPEQAMLVAFDAVRVAFEENGAAAIAATLAVVVPWTTELADRVGFEIIQVNDVQESQGEVPVEALYLGDLLAGRLDHRQRISLWQNQLHWDDWMLKFFCKKAPDTAIKNLLVALKGLGFQPAWLKSGRAGDFAKWLKKGGILKAIQSAYEVIPGADKSHNIVSMCCYSGPHPDERWHRHHHPRLLHTALWPVRESQEIDRRVGWIGTGDLGLKDEETLRQFHAHYAEEIPLVGTMQVPHHGSQHNSDHRLVIGKDLLLTVSYGSDNRYHHPDGRVILELQRHGAHVWPVTEQAESAMRQTIFLGL